MRTDPPSALAAAFVLGRLLGAPGSATRLAGGAIHGYGMRSRRGRPRRGIRERANGRPGELRVGRGPQLRLIRRASLASSQLIPRGARFRGPMEFHSSSFKAIGVTNQVTVCALDALEDAVAIARAEVAALDLACSRFREDSEIVSLNESGAGGQVVSALLFEAVEVALDAARATGGLVDPTVGGALRGLGYDRDFDVVVTAAPKPAFRLVPACGWESVRLDRASRRISLGRRASSTSVPPQRPFRRIASRRRSRRRRVLTSWSAWGVTSRLRARPRRLAGSRR